MPRLLLPVEFLEEKKRSQKLKHELFHLAVFRKYYYFDIRAMVLRLRRYGKLDDSPELMKEVYFAGV